MGILGFSSEGLKWILLAGIFLLAGLGVSIIRRMLSGFSKMALLESLGERERARLEDLFPHILDYQQGLWVIEQGIRLALISSLAFALIYRARESLESWVEILNFLGFLALVTLIFIMIFYFLPGVVARNRQERILRYLLPALGRFHAVLATLGKMNAILVGTCPRTKSAEEKPPREGDSLSAENGERRGILEEEGEISVIESLIRFRDREVSNVMTPRTEMVCLDFEESIEDSVRIAIDCGHSRIPVFRENKDNIVGLLYVKDLLRFWNRRQEAPVRLEDVIRKPHFVPETKKLSELFQEFKSQRFHIAIIIDEFGGTSGLITIEDIIEEIVGEIMDEYEKEERPDFKRLGADAVEIDARIPIHELNERLEVELPESDGYDTVGGFLFSSLGKVPIVGDSVEHGRIRIEVIDADERRINRLRVRIAGEEQSGENQRKG